jgi:uncharacterized phage infection (PIP) family protein YhgE
MLGDSNAGLAPALQEFFRSVDQVAANPSQLATRQSMVSTAQALSARYQALGDQLAQMNDSINGEITASVAEINSYAEQIATLNQQIGTRRSLDRSARQRSAGQPGSTGVRAEQTHQDHHDAQWRWQLQRLHRQWSATGRRFAGGQLLRQRPRPLIPRACWSV